jgi:anti-sigma B factor antagonist
MKHMEFQPLVMDVQHVSHGEENVLVLTIRGDAGMTDAFRMGDTLQDLLSQPEHVIVLDLAGLQFIGGEGIDVLLTVRERIIVEKGQMRLVQPTPEVRHILEVTRLDQILPIYDSLEEALAAGG